MGILGYFFKLSYVMKDYHKILTEDYKFSTWVSYAFFTAATILVGGLLGLVSTLIISLQTSAFTYRVPSKDLILKLWNIWRFIKLNKLQKSNYYYNRAWISG